MSVRQRQEPIYQRPINSLEDLDQALNHNERIEQEIAITLNGRPFKNLYSNTEQLPKYLESVRFFTEAYWGSLGFAACLDVVKGLHRYQELLTEAMLVCKDKITPLFLRSFACHQRALQQFQEPQQKTLAVASMAETGAIAKEITEEYENIGRTFLALHGNIERAHLTLVKEQVVLIKREKALVTQQNVDSGNTLHETAPFLKRSILALDEAINALRKIQPALLNVSFFWKGANACISNHHRSPELGDPLLIEIFASNDLAEADNTFYECLKEAEKESTIPQGNFPFGNPLSFSDVPQSIKTGISTVISDTPTPFTDLLEAIRGIEKEFEKSYLNWLALAKINDTAIDLMENGLIEAQKIQRVILQVESDPLAIALHANAESSTA